MNTLISNIFRVHLGKETGEAKKAGSSTVLNFSVIKTTSQDDEAAVWYQAALWGTRAEKMSGNIRNNDTFFISGTTYARQYEDAEGQTKVSHVLQINEISRVKQLPLYGANDGGDAGAADTGVADIAAKAESEDDIPF